MGLFSCCSGDVDQYDMSANQNYGESGSISETGQTNNYVQVNFSNEIFVSLAMRRAKIWHIKHINTLPRFSQQIRTPQSIFNHNQHNDPSPMAMHSAKMATLRRLCAPCRRKSYINSKILLVSIQLNKETIIMF